MKYTNHTPRGWSINNVIKGDILQVYALKIGGNGGVATWQTLPNKFCIFKMFTEATKYKLC